MKCVTGGPPPADHSPGRQPQSIYGHSPGSTYFVDGGPTWFYEE
jgi:hypothetical protein